MSELPNIDELWDYSNPKATEIKFRKLLPDAVGSGDPIYHGELLTQIARTHSLQGKYQSAHRLLSQIEMMEMPGMEVVTVRRLLEQGRTYNSSGDKPSSVLLFKQALDTAKAENLDFYAVDAAHMLGIASPIEAQLEWNLEAIKIAEASEDPKAKKWSGSLLNNIGWTYFEQEKYDDALLTFRKCEDWFRRAEKTKQRQIATWSIAKTLRLKNELETALEMQENLLKEYGGKDPSGYTYEEIGECLHAMNKPEAAAPWFLKAYRKLVKDEWLLKNESERINRLQELSAY